MKSPKEWSQFEWENPLMTTGDFIAEIQKDSYNQAVQDAADNLTKTCSEFSDLRWDDNDIYKKSILKLKIK